VSASFVLVGAAIAGNGRSSAMTGPSSPLSGRRESGPLSGRPKAAIDAHLGPEADFGSETDSLMQARRLAP